MAFSRSAATAVVLVGLASAALGGQVQLDISDGFTMDCWLGPREMQAVLRYNAAFSPDVNLRILQTWPRVGWGVWESYSQHLIVGASPDEGYDLQGKFIVRDGQGTPADGVIRSDDWVYHVASFKGNATLPGDWLEAEHLATPDYPREVDVETSTSDRLQYRPFSRRDLMAARPNAIVIGAAHNRGFWQIAESEAVLPVDQRAAYNELNVVLCAFSGERASGMQIVAAYEDGSRDVLYAFPTDEVRLCPSAQDRDDQRVGDRFRPVCSFTGAYSYTTMASGAVRLNDLERRLYEFRRPLLLDPGRKLRSLRIVDAEADRQWQSRGLAVFAATAFRAGRPGPLDPAVSTVDGRPSSDAPDGAVACDVVVVLKDAERNRVGGRAAEITFDIAGPACAAGPVAETGPGIYRASLTSPTPGRRKVRVRVGDQDLTGTATVELRPVGRLPGASGATTRSP